MIEFAQPRVAARHANVESAIDQTSFRLPVLIAISSTGREQQVVRTFAAAHEVFDQIFALLVDRLRQRLAVDKVVNLVPARARMTESTDAEYVLVVRGKALFWFSGAAAQRSAARRLLLEHARDLADAERAPFYRINSRARIVRLAVVVLAVAASAAAALLATQLTIGWGAILERKSAGNTPPAVISMEAGGRHVARGGNDGAQARDANKPTADFAVPAGGWLGDGALAEGDGKQPATP